MKKKNCILNLHEECFNLTQICRNKNWKELNPLQKNLSSTFLKLKFKIEKMVKNRK